MRQEGLRQRQGSLVRVQGDVARQGILAPGGRATRPGQSAVLRRLNQRLQGTDHGVLHWRGRAGALRVSRTLRHRAVRRGDPNVTAGGRQSIRRRGGDRTTGRSADVHPLNGRHLPVLVIGTLECPGELRLPVHSMMHLIPLLHSGACVWTSIRARCINSMRFTESIAAGYRAYAKLL